VKVQPLLLATPGLGGLQLRSTAQGTSAPTGDSKPARTEKSDSVELSAEAQEFLELTPEEQDQVDELKQRDQEVRTHEQAHAAAAGPHLRGGPTYDYQTGPDGKNYAIGGEVQIDTSPVDGDPEATIRKAQQVRAAALAPAEPSAQDRAVASAATQVEAQARSEIQNQETESSEAGSTTKASQNTTKIQPDAEFDQQILQAYQKSAVRSRTLAFA